MMKKNRIGKTSLVVSEIGLGTMTFGSSCDETEAFRIMDRSLDAGIDFFDTAEIYPVPPKLDWVYKTEEIIGKWLKDKDRYSIIIATKVAGPGHGWFSPPIRKGKTALDRHHIKTAIEGSLKRLGTEFIDLYQTHWPDPDGQYEETLDVLDELIREGKIRYIGCSNETSWGLMKSLWTSDVSGLPRYDSIQNNFSLLNRRFMDDLALICRKENVSLLPYSPLAGGVLTGKYNGTNSPENARFSRYKKEGERQVRMANRFLNNQSISATEEYMKIAEEAGYGVIEMAVAWSKMHDFVASTLIGANSVSQLEDSLKANKIKLTDDVLKKIDEVNLKIQYPMG
jgi:aryl-alcohol dehydrogenase-like predicted oxidoreductase